MARVTTARARSGRVARFTPTREGGVGPPLPSCVTTLEEGEAMSTVEEPEFDPEELAKALVLTVAALLRTPTIRHALQDLLRTYGLTAQIAEIMGDQRNQIQAMAEAMTMVHGRLLEHDKLALKNHLKVMKCLEEIQLYLTANDINDTTTTS